MNTYTCAGCGEPAQTTRPDHKPRYCTVECANLHIHTIPARERLTAIRKAMEGLPTPLPWGTYAKIGRELGITGTAVARLLRKDEEADHEEGQ